MGERSRGMVSATVATAVRVERVRRNWTQADLARHLGWPRSTVAALETRRHELRIDEAVQLCLALDVSLADLLAAEPEVCARLGLTGDAPSWPVPDETTAALFMAVKAYLDARIGKPG